MAQVVKPPKIDVEKLIAEGKLPRVDLKELARLKRLNRKQRLEFIRYYAKLVREGYTA